MADKAKNVVLNFKMNGQVQYAETVREINSIMNTAAKEYKNHIAAMGADGTATDKLRAEKKKLEIQMESAQKRTQMLSAQYDAMSKNTKTTTGQLTQMYGKLLDAENAEVSLQKSIDRVNGGLTDQAQEAREAQQTLDQLKGESKLLEAEQKALTSSFKLQTAELGDNASEAEKVLLAQKQLDKQMDLTKRAVSSLENQLDATKKAYGENSVEVMQLETKINDARSEMARFSRGLGEVEENAQDAEGKLGKLGGGLQALGGAITAAAIAGLVENTKELSTELSRLQANAETWGFTGTVVEDAFKKVAAVSGDTGAAVETISNLMATSFDDNQLAEAIEHINGAYVQFSDTLSTEGIADGLQETFAIGEAAGSFAELLERSGISLDTFNSELTKAKKAGTETDYVLQTLADTGVKSFYESYQESNKALIEANEAEVEHQLALKELGDTLRPLVTEIVAFTTKIIEWASENPKLTQGLVIAAAAIGALVAAAAILAPIITAVTSVIGIAGVSIGALLTPIGITIAAIVALVAVVAGIILVIKNWGSITDWIGDKWDQFIAWLSKVTPKLAADFVMWVMSLKNGAINGFNDLVIGGIAKVTGLKDGALAVISTFKNNAVNKANELKNDFVGKVTGLKDDAINRFNNLRDKAGDVMRSAKDNIVSPITEAKDKICGIVDSITGFFSNMKLSIPKIDMPPLPHFSLTGDFSLNPPSVPKLSIDWRAKGGIFTQPTIFGTTGGRLQGAGEAGPEAVLPLNAETLGAIGEGIAKTMGKHSGVVQHIQIISPDPTSPSENARKFKQASRQLAMEL